MCYGLFNEEQPVVNPVFAAATQSAINCNRVDCERPLAIAFGKADCHDHVVSRRRRTCTSPPGERGFLTDTLRIKVALTRARRKQIVIGDSSTLANPEFHIRLLDYRERADAYGTVCELGEPP